MLRTTQISHKLWESISDFYNIRIIIYYFFHQRVLILISRKKLLGTKELFFFSFVTFITGSEKSYKTFCNMIKYWLTTELSQQGRDTFARQCCGLHFTQHEYIVIYMSFFIEMFLPCFYLSSNCNNTW